MMACQRQQVVRFVKRPTGNEPFPAPGEHLVVSTEEVPQQVPVGSVLLRHHYLSVNNVMLNLMRHEVKNISGSLDIDSIMVGAVVAEVVLSRCEALPVGTYVLKMLGGNWCEYSVAERDSLTPLTVDSRIPMASFLGALGYEGLTSYIGLIDVGQPVANNTVVVTAATGIFGAVACQLAKWYCHCRVVGITGGGEKCTWLRNELGIDASVDYQAPDFAEQLKKSCPQGIDVVFDSVGGELLRQCMRHINEGARIVVNGVIDSQSGSGQTSSRPFDFTPLIMKHARIEGFLSAHPKWKAGNPHRLKILQELFLEGKLKHHSTVIDGLENATDALLLLFNRGTFHGKVHKVGKVLIRISGHGVTTSARL